MPDFQKTLPTPPSPTPRPLPQIAHQKETIQVTHQMKQFLYLRCSTSFQGPSPILLNREPPELKYLPAAAKSHLVYHKPTWSNPKIAQQWDNSHDLTSNKPSFHQHQLPEAIRSHQEALYHPISNSISQGPSQNYSKELETSPVILTIHKSSYHPWAKFTPTSVAENHCT